jgi:uncharacterized phage protein gp47/JayE
MAAQVYAAFSPATGQGAGLSSNVKINGLRRSIATNSVVNLLCIGQRGTLLSNGVVQDENGNKWLLPTNAVIQFDGQLVVTAVAADAGNVTLPSFGIDTANNVGTILTPIRGWQSASNPLPAVAGDPIETDTALRQRQSLSTALPSLTVLDGIVGAVAAIPGVTRQQAYENDTGVVDVNGIPAHSLAMVVDGGDAVAIATAIMLKKTPGAGTYGTTSETVTDAYNVPHTISFFVVTPVVISVAITIDPLPGFVTTTEGIIQQAIADYINTLPIGVDVLWTKLYSPANLAGVTTLSTGDTVDPALTNTYNVISIAIAASGGTPQSIDIPIFFNAAASCTINNVALTAIVNP